jgi:photosystem II stability/assembly factor-like uncharacterized protein
LLECQFKLQITLIYKGLNQMKTISRIAFIFATFTFVSATHALAETLQELATKTHYHGIAFARSGTAVLLLASHHGLFAVDKAGNATQVSVVQDYMGFSPEPSDPLTYFASGHPHTGGNSGFLKSVDGGATWKQISSGVNGPVDFHQMDVSPADPQTIYGNYGGLQVSHDGGNTWAAVGPVPDSLIAIAASSVKAETLYAATKNGLHISVNGGVNWQPLAFDGEVVGMVKSGPKGMLLAFVLGKGLMKATEEKPMEWTSVSNGFGDAIVLHLAINPKNNTQLALTTQDNAVLESKDNGVTWVPFGQAQ